MPSDVLLHYSTILGRLVNNEENSRGTPLDALMKDQEKLDKLLDEATKLG